MMHVITGNIVECSTYHNDIEYHFNQDVKQEDTIDGRFYRRKSGTPQKIHVNYIPKCPCCGGRIVLSVYPLDEE